MIETAKIAQDKSIKNPRERENLGTMICDHPIYNLGDQTSINPQAFKGLDEMRAYLVNKMGAVVILPLYLLDRSGLWINTGPFSDQWNSYQMGFIYVSMDKLLKEYGKCDQESKDKARKALIAEVNAYSRFISNGKWYSL